MSLTFDIWGFVLKKEVKFVPFLGFLVLFSLGTSPSFLKAESDSQATPNSISSFFKKRAEGWHWYESQEPEIRDQESGVKNQETRTLNPTQMIKAQRKALEEKLHTAILEPTDKNITSYLIAQKALMDQSQRFSESWRRVVMTTPSLDETLIHPVDQNAKHIYYAEQSQKLQKRIQGLAREYGLFFFFRENCPYCHTFAPIVKRFAQKYGWSVLAISMDGGTLPEFPEARRDNGISKRLQIAHVPALIALHLKILSPDRPDSIGASPSGERFDEGQLIPLAYGMVSESEIENRIELLTRLEEKSK